MAKLKGSNKFHAGVKLQLFTRALIGGSTGDSGADSDSWSSKNSKEVVVAKSVVEKLKRRVMQLRKESKANRAKCEKEEEEKMEEKARAAAWAWYQRGKGGKESKIPTTITAHIGHGAAPKTSRFKTEALKRSTSISQSSARSEPPSEPAGGHSWAVSPSRTSSLFDMYELDSVSKRIDYAFHDHERQEALAPEVIPKIARSSSLRMLQFPRSICRSISDVVTPEEMALHSGSAGKSSRSVQCECPKNRHARSGSWVFRRLSKTNQDLVHLPECELRHQGQQRHVQGRHSQEHHEHHHHHHHHKHAHHHHIHYQVKLNEGMQQYGNSVTTFPRKSNVSEDFLKEV